MRRRLAARALGKDIINECLAARIVVRVTDGLSLHEALAKSFRESYQHQCDLGAIGLDATGAIGWGKTSEVLLAAYHTGEAIGDTLEWQDETLVGSVPA